MFHSKLKETLNTSIAEAVSDIDSFVYNPGRDYSRVKKLSADQVLSFLISQGASSTKCEFLDFFQMSPETPSLSSLNQRRSQLKPEALETVFHKFTSASRKLDVTSREQRYQYIAADGSSISFFSFPKFTSDDYFISEGHSMNGFYSMHLNAFYDIENHIYTDAVLQSAHKKDEFLAFCQMVDRHIPSSDIKTVFIGDRGYCSYNNMAHVIEKEQYFVFRSKDITSKGILSNFAFPDSDTFDITVNVTLTRSQRKSIKIKSDFYRRFVDKAASFDYIEYASTDTYDMSFRIVRFMISEDTYECIVTNLPQEEFGAEELKKIYNSRWSIESSFRKLKYTIGVSYYHSYKPDFIKQEIWAKFIAYNATELLVAHTVVTHGKRKYSYKVNFTLAAHICRIYLRLHTETDSMDVMALLQKELVPVRNDRQFPRLKTAHFRKPKYLIYRVS